MKTMLIMAAFIIGFAASSQAAGRGTIRETETQIIVEYSDDAAESKPEAAQNASGVHSAQPGDVKVEEDKPVDLRRQKIESKRAQRAAQRKQEQERDQNRAVEE